MNKKACALCVIRRSQSNLGGMCIILSTEAAVDRIHKIIWCYYIPTAMYKYIAKGYMLAKWVSDTIQSLIFVLREPYAVKVARTVLWGERVSNDLFLPSQRFNRRCPAGLAIPRLRTPALF